MKIQKAHYIVGMLVSKSGGQESSTTLEQEVEGDIAYGESEDYTAGVDDDNEPIMTTNFKLPTSIGISFYVDSQTKSINIDVNGEIMFVLLKRELEKQARSIIITFICDSQ